MYLYKVHLRENSSFHMLMYERVQHRVCTYIVHRCASKQNVFFSQGVSLQKRYCDSLAKKKLQNTIVITCFKIFNFLGVFFLNLVSPLVV